MIGYILKLLYPSNSSTDEQRKVLLSFMLWVVIIAYFPLGIYFHFSFHNIIFYYAFFLSFFNLFLYYLLIKRGKIVLVINAMLTVNFIFYFGEGYLFGWHSMSLFKIFLSILCVILLEYKEKLYTFIFMVGFMLNSLLIAYYPPVIQGYDFSFIPFSVSVLTSSFAYIVIKIFINNKVKLTQEMNILLKKVELSHKVIENVNMGVIISNKDNVIYKNSWFSENELINDYLKELLDNNLTSNKNYIEKYCNGKYYRIIGVDLTTEEQNKYYAFFIDDITDLRKQQKLLELTSEKLVDEITEKNTFISILAHDLKNPFNAILNYIEMLTIIKDNPEKVVSTIDKLKNITTNTYKFFENLLTLIKIQTNRVLLNSEYLNICNLIEEVINNNQIIADLKNIRINKKSSNLTIKYDYMMIYTILNNILSNAIKYSYSGSEINIKVALNNNVKLQKNSTTIISTENVEDRVYLEISITDSGTGISQDKLKKLLKMDSIASEDGTDNEKGTGLGLLICKQYLNKIGGILVISSTLNEGTEIKIFLPYNGEVI